MKDIAVGGATIAAGAPIATAKLGASAAISGAAAGMTVDSADIVNIIKQGVPAISAGVRNYKFCS